VGAFTVSKTISRTHSGALQILDKIARYEPLGYSTPQFACLTSESVTHFSEITPPIMSMCSNREALVLKEQNYILICPDTWSLPTEPLSPDHSNCPFVIFNEYADPIQRYISNVVVDALVRWRLQNGPSPLPEPRDLNAMVRLNARYSYLSAMNYDAYISMVKNRCTVHPNLSLPPWSPWLSANPSEAASSYISDSLSPLTTTGLSSDATS